MGELGRRRLGGRRSGAGMSVVVVVAALLIAPGASATAASSGERGGTVLSPAPCESTIDWMVVSDELPSLNALFGGNNTLTTCAFDRPSTFVIGQNTHSPTAMMPTRVFEAAGLPDDPMYDSDSFAYVLAHGGVPPHIAVLYDDESWAATPTSEQTDPGSAMIDFVKMAHTNGDQAILAPALDLTNVMQLSGTQTSCATGPSIWQDYLDECNIPGLVAAADPDGYVIQAQDTELEQNRSIYQTLVTQAAAEVTADVTADSGTPITTILAGLSTNIGWNGGRSVATPDALDADTKATFGPVPGLDGYWLNVPSSSGGDCPKCGNGDPAVAAQYLLDQGYDVTPASATGLDVAASTRVEIRWRWARRSSCPSLRRSSTPIGWVTPPVDRSR